MNELDEATKKELEEYKKGLIVETATAIEPKTAEKAVEPATDPKRITGRISALYPKGFGFIRSGAETLFLHRSKLIGQEFCELSIGQLVTFEAIEPDRPGGCRQAVNVKPVEGSK